MSGRPQRALPKQDMHIVLDEKAYATVCSFVESANVPMTKSRLIETLVFLMREEYLHDTRRTLMPAWYNTRFSVLAARATEGRRQTHTLHVTLDQNAKQFCELICMKHREAFPNISEVVNMFVHRLARVVEDGHAAWAQRRLEEILIKYPLRYR